MPTTRITEKLSQLVASQLPEYVRFEFPAFVDFLEAYYRYLEQDQNAQEIIQNARSYADIDKTASGFVQYFLKNYGKDLPQSILADKALLLKQVYSLYESKGSSLSFNLLFRILFNTDVSVNYPFENVLRASDGTWQQLISLRVETDSGDWQLLENHFLKIVKNQIVYSTPVFKTKRLREGLTEVYFELNSPSIIENVFEIGDQVYVEESGNVVFSGTITPTTTSLNILTGGSGFKIGQVFKVNSGGAVNTLFKVTNTSPIGAVTEARIINYGYDYTDNIVLNFKADRPVGVSGGEYNTITNGFSEKLEIAYYQPTDPDRYFLEDYVDDFTYAAGNVQIVNTATVVSGGTSLGDIDNTYSTLSFFVGALGKYPGLYTTNRGFLSDNEIRLQDGGLYQAFAYQTVTDIDISVFYDIVKSTIHPAGQQLFNNRLLQNTINVNSNINVISASNVFTESYSSVETNDSIIKDIAKVLTDTKSLLDNVSLTVYHVVDNAVSQVSLESNSSLEVNKVFDDTSVMLDVSNIEAFISIDNSISIATINDSNISFNTSRVETDSITLSDVLNITANVSINNTDSLVSVSDSNISAISFVQDYAETGYFAELYSANPPEGVIVI